VAIIRTARVLRAEGARVVVADVDLDAARAVAAALSADGEHALAIETDVTSRSAVDRMAAETVARWGRIDILAANAGIYPHIPLAELDQDRFDRLIAINVRGALFAVQACIPTMTERGYGRIVLTSSITGSIVGQPGYAHYGASKAAMLGLMRSAALEVAEAGITVNAVLPGKSPRPVSANSGPSTRQPCWRRSRSAASVSPRTWAGRCASWPRPRPATSPAKRS
jgi:3-oxoacyl-[acyl-carrier protein] reductase